MEVDLKKWHRCEVDKKQFSALIKKSDWPGFKHMIIFFGSLFFFGYFAFLTWGTWWSVLFFLIYGNIYCNCDAIWHETGHKTAFKSKFWNEFFYQIASYMNNFEPVRWRWSHFKHHGHTASTKDPHDFEIAISKPTDVLYFFSLFIPFANVFYLHKSLQFETLQHSLGITTRVLRECVPEREINKCRTSARIHVSIWIISAGVSLYFNSWLPLLYIVLPVFYGNTLRVAFGLTQHSGLQENIKDHRYSTRTVILNPIFSFLYWHMEYHIEHHMFPTVPSYNLPKLHTMIKDQMPPAKKGLWGAYSEIIPAIIKQSKDPNYNISLSVPN
jgi:fatty acid desaturase